MSTGPLYAMGGAHPHALERNDAMRGLATGNREGKTVEREQEILTPSSVTDIARAVFGGQIQLDPCEPMNGCSVNAVLGYTGPHTIYDNGLPGLDGLVEPWVDGTFINPPYRDLKAWLAKSALEGCEGNEQMLLIPVRPNRTWWCSYMRTVSAFAYLKPLKFEGFKQAFPAPLALVYLGPKPQLFEIVVGESGLATFCRVGGL